MAPPDTSPPSRSRSVVNGPLHDSVSALVYSIAKNYADLKQPNLGPPYNDLTEFVLLQQSQLPDFLRWPMRALTLGFDMLGCFRTGHCFHSQHVPNRARQIAAWKKSKLSFQRDFIRYYESLAAFSLYSRDELLKANALPSNAATGLSDSAFERVLSEPPANLRCEIAVVGSGPGGSITACLLAEAGRDVLLLEEGSFHTADSCPPFSRQEMLKKYRNGGQTVALGKNKIAYVEGRCVGGGSEINSGLYHRTPPEILESWRAGFGVEALAETDLLAYYEANERELSVSLLPATAPAASLKLHEGATRLGWKSLEVPRWVRYTKATNDSGARQTMTRTFVPRFLKAGGRLSPSTRVKRILQKGNRFELLAQHSGGTQVRIEADFLFLCAGAIQTPALLRRSGIKRNIGNSLQLHPTVKLAARFPELVNSAEMGVPVHQVKHFAPRLTFGCSISTPAYLALGSLDHAGNDLPHNNWSHCANYYAMIAGEGHGTVRALPHYRDAFVRYRLAKQDRALLADGLRKLTSLLFEAGANMVLPALPNVPSLLKSDDIKKLPEILPEGSSGLMTIHLFSSCPMGEDQSKCAVNSFGQLHGFKNLFVSDASILCTAPGVNPQGTLMALARRNVMCFLKAEP
jgi:choline dehydrogenase-like flavoprotein